MSININGKNYHGNNITVKNGKIIIDGVDKVINITVDGNIEKLNVDECEKVEVNGSCGSVKTMSGDVKCGEVTSNVKTMSGDVRCGDVVSTMSGDVDYTKSATKSEDSYEGEFKKL